MIHIWYWYELEYIEYVFAVNSASTPEYGIEIQTHAHKYTCATAFVDYINVLETLWDQRNIGTYAKRPQWGLHLSMGLGRS